MRPLGNCGGERRGHMSTVQKRDSGSSHLLAARLARMLVAIAGVFELGAALEELEDQLVGLATHGAHRIAARKSWRGDRGRSAFCQRGSAIPNGPSVHVRYRRPQPSLVDDPFKVLYILPSWYPPTDFDSPPDATIPLLALNRPVQHVTAY
jgi:hypothetical protein